LYITVNQEIITHDPKQHGLFI